jgi:hypothetical protein
MSASALRSMAFDKETILSNTQYAGALQKYKLYMKEICFVFLASVITFRAVAFDNKTILSIMQYGSTNYLRKKYACFSRQSLESLFDRPLTSHPRT